MKQFLKFVGILAWLAALFAILMVILIPWMDHWGATGEEIAASFPGDELVPEPASFVNHAITINAAPEYIYDPSRYLHHGTWLVDRCKGKRRASCADRKPATVARSDNHA